MDAAPELGGREAEFAFVVADDADGDNALLGADHHAFHQTFLGRGDLAGERNRRGGLGMRRKTGVAQRQANNGGEQHP